MHAEVRFPTPLSWVQVAVTQAEPLLKKPQLHNGSTPEAESRSIDEKTRAKEALSGI